MLLRASKITISSKFPTFLSSSIDNPNLTNHLIITIIHSTIFENVRNKLSSPITLFSSRLRSFRKLIVSFSLHLLFENLLQFLQWKHHSWSFRRSEKMKFSFWRRKNIILADCTKRRGNRALLSRNFRYFITISGLPKFL